MGSEPLADAAARPSLVSDSRAEAAAAVGV